MQATNQLAVSSEHTTAHSFDTHALSEILNTLEILADNLDKNDLSAAKVAHQLQDQLNGNYINEVSEIIQKIDNLNYDMALTDVNKMRDNFQKHQIGG